MSRLGGCGRVLTFLKNISLGLRLAIATLGILSMHEQLVTLQGVKSHHMTPFNVTSLSEHSDGNK